MKHITKFNEHNDKTIMNIEDILLMFVDNNELLEYSVRNDNSKWMNYQPGYRIRLVLPDEIIGFKRLEVIDKVINRLKRKYEYIYYQYDANFSNTNFLQLSLNPINDLKDELVTISFEKAYRDKITELMSNLDRKMYNLSASGKPYYKYYNIYRQAIFEYRPNEKSFSCSNRNFMKKIDFIYNLRIFDKEIMIVELAKKILNLDLDTDKIYDDSSVG